MTKNFDFGKWGSYYEVFEVLKLAMVSRAGSPFWLVERLRGCEEEACANEALLYPVRSTQNQQMGSLMPQIFHLIG